MKKLANVYKYSQEYDFENATIWVNFEDAETVITDEDYDSPCLILTCYMYLGTDCYGIRDFLHAHHIERTKYTRIVAIYGKYEPAIHALRLTVQHSSDVQSKSNEEGKMYFQKKSLNLESPNFGKKRIRNDNANETQPPKKKQRTIDTVRQKSLYVNSIDNDNNNDNNNNYNNNNKRNNYMQVNLLSRKTLNDDNNINNTSVRPPLPSLDAPKQNINNYSSISTDKSINIMDKTTYSDSDGDDDFGAFIHAAKVKKYQINDKILAIQDKQRILMKHLSCIFSKTKPFVNHYYIIANLIATKNICIHGRYKGFKLIFQGVDDTVMTMVVWDGKKTGVQQYLINTIHVIVKFKLKKKNENEQKYNADTNNFIISGHINTRIFPLVGTPEDYNISAHFPFEFTTLSLNDEEKNITIKNMVTHLYQYPTIIAAYDAKMKINKDNTITPTGVNVMGVIADFKLSTTNNKNQLDLVLQYKQHAIHAVAWDINEVYALTKYQIVAIINGCLSLRSNGVHNKLQIKITDNSLLIFNPYHSILSEKIERFKRGCMKYYGLHEVAIQSRFKVAKYEKTLFEQISIVAGRTELVKDYYFYCVENLLISKIDFGDSRCPFSLYCSSHNCYVQPSEKNISLKTNDGYNVNLDEVTINWNLFFILKNETKPDVDVVRGKCHFNLISTFYKENKNIKQLFMEWRKDSKQFINKLESLFINIEITKLKCIFERRKNNYQIIFYDAIRV